MSDSDCRHQPVVAGADHRDTRRHLPHRLLDISRRYPPGVVGESPNLLVSNAPLRVSMAPRGRGVGSADRRLGVASADQA
jgi:hypothetical protein